MTEIALQGEQSCVRVEIQLAPERIKVTGLWFINEVHPYLNRACRCKKRMPLHSRTEQLFVGKKVLSRFYDELVA